ncbi:unnamed protein product [Allacma fusca]|uniref:Uncharacterized protein n=1 Tax=Allacma fusca TaxID=39272 RepID=A0A8J2P633_9HEXA|nr:unnamed protein product [Allacma fusca]
MNFRVRNCRSRITCVKRGNWRDSLKKHENKKCIDAHIQIHGYYIRSRSSSASFQIQLSKTIVSVRKTCIFNDSRFNSKKLHYKNLLPENSKTKPVTQKRERQAHKENNFMDTHTPSITTILLRTRYSIFKV